MYLQMALVQKPGSENYSASPIFPLIRAGILNGDGKFACFAANWYYNRQCFPNRPLDAPKTLRELIIESIETMSATRLRQAVQNGRFPKEAAFQQLMNEAMSMKLPARHSITPEFGTIAVDSQDPNAKPVTGELDFYVNGQMKWCIEMVRQCDGIGEHMGRFKKVQDSKGNKGKYRKVEMKEYYVVDCRSAKNGRGASLEPHKCVLYFADDFTTCTCAIKGHPEVTINLQM
ncbi:expressed unknown protein [Seminavis robusta]|uniref:Uncharacterized protein n=1 Tax=Seminavis robusta TaxID=568900 RepID=A0A9N8HC94_9STRA|nr:expressed unknown protein [Seminavis robusta]|eukprot:Sro310_g113930.1 n/a (231) ;mRNA; r:1271-1963